MIGQVQDQAQYNTKMHIHKNISGSPEGPMLILARHLLRLVTH